MEGTVLAVRSNVCREILKDVFGYYIELADNKKTRNKQLVDLQEGYGSYGDFYMDTDMEGNSRYSRSLPRVGVGQLKRVKDLVRDLLTRESDLAVARREGYQQGKKDFREASEKQTERARKAENDVDQLKYDLRELQPQMESLQKEVAQLRVNRKHLMESLTKANEASDAYDKAGSELQTQLIDMEKEIAMLKESNSELRAFKDGIKREDIGSQRSLPLPRNHGQCTSHGWKLLLRREPGLMSRIQ